jgi:2-aminoadipate transaminase
MGQFVARSQTGDLGLAEAVGRISSSAIRELLDLVNRPGIISLAGGLPAPELFPRDRTLSVVTELLGGAGSDGGALQYSSTEGDAELRAWIGARHGVSCDRVLITHGSQQALDIAARALVDVGTPVVLADPGYVGAIQALRLSGGCLVGVPSDGEGMCVDALEDRLASGLRPRLVYVVPNFHNPTGETLSAERVRRLGGLADRYGFLIVEDDPYGEIRFAGQAAPALATATDRVISIGTISKVLFPGLRVGWMVAPAALAPWLALVKQAVDLHTSTLAQKIAGRLLADADGLAAHLEGVRHHYRTRATVLAQALQDQLGETLDFRWPDGGLFLWATVAGGVDTAALLPRALDHGVAYVPGAAFSVTAGQGDNGPGDTGPGDTLRLSYATVGATQLETAVGRLAQVLRPDHRPRPPGAA